MTSILQGAVKRGTAKKLRSLKVPLAGKTGTTNDNYDAWFIGFSSNLVIGVYIGSIIPKHWVNLKRARKQHFLFLKILLKKHFIKRTLMSLPIRENIYLTSINYDTGIKSRSGEKNSIVEALKLEDINKLDNNNLILSGSRDKIIKFRQFY